MTNEPEARTWEDRFLDNIHGVIKEARFEQKYVNNGAKSRIFLQCHLLLRTSRRQKPLDIRV